MSPQTLYAVLLFSLVMAFTPGPNNMMLAASGARFGIARALWIARALHAAAFLALVWLFLVTKLGPIALVGVIATAALLVYQHRLVRPNDLSRLNAAFFTTNAFVSVILLATFGSAVFLNR